MDELERILEDQESIEPSSGLTDAVMRAVLSEAQAPPPISFPWVRMLVGMGLCAGLIMAGVVLALIYGLPATPSVEPRWLSIDPQTAFSVGVPLATILLSLFALRLSLRAMR